MKPDLANLLELIREHEGITRAELMEQTGLSRTTLTARLNALVEQRLVTAVEGGVSTGGRPPVSFAFNPGAGVVLVIDAGATRTQLGVMDLSGVILAQSALQRLIGTEPSETLKWMCAGLDELLTETGHGHAHVRGIGIALPGPVDFGRGRPVSPLLMPGWDEFPVGDTLSAHFAAPALVDNDVNVMALGEARTSGSDEPLVVVKAGTGIGLGYVTMGVVQRGAQGCAGDVGHIRVPDAEDVVCRCGKRGCVQAVAGGRQMAERLREAGIECEGTADIATLARSGSPEAIAAVRRAGHAIGFVIAAVINVLNPARVVVAGDLAEARDFLLSALRETVYRESTTLATVELEITRAHAGGQAGLLGAGTMAIEHVLSSN